MCVHIYIDYSLCPSNPSSFLPSPFLHCLALSPDMIPSPRYCSLSLTFTVHSSCLTSLLLLFPFPLFPSFLSPYQVISTFPCIPFSLFPSSCIFSIISLLSPFLLFIFLFLFLSLFSFQLFLSYNFLFLS